MANSNGLITAPINLAADIYKVLGISARNGVFDVAYACANTHGKIRREARYKPYATGGPGELTDAERAAFNYGMTPVAVDTAVRDLPGAYTWGQWTPPVPGRDWSRMTDFENYDHTSREHVLGIMLSSESGGKPVVWNPQPGAQNRDSYYTGSVTFAPAGRQLLLSDFYYGSDPRYNDLGGMHLTLWAGGGTSGSGFRQKWLAQSAESLRDWVASHPSGGQWTVSMRTTDLHDGSAAGSGSLRDAIDAAGGSIVAIGLAPKQSNFNASDPAAPLSPTGEGLQVLISMRMYRHDADWHEFSQWKAFTDPGYAYVGDNTDLYGTVLMFLSVGDRQVEDSDGIMQWPMIPASSFERQAGTSSVRMKFKDTVCTHTTSHIRVPTGSKARLTAHVCLCRTKGSGIEVIERKSVESVNTVTVDPASGEWKFTPGDMTGTGDDQRHIDLLFDNSLTGRFLTLQYELDPADVTIYRNTDGSVNTDATVGSAGEYFGLSTGIQRMDYL